MIILNFLDAFTNIGIEIKYSLSPMLITREFSLNLSHDLTKSLEFGSSGMKEYLIKEAISANERK